MGGCSNQLSHTSQGSKLFKGSYFLKTSSLMIMSNVHIRGNWVKSTWELSSYLCSSPVNLNLFKNEVFQKDGSGGGEYCLPIQNALLGNFLPYSLIVSFKDFPPLIPNSADLLVTKYNTALLAIFHCLYWGQTVISYFIMNISWQIHTNVHNSSGGKHSVNILFLRLGLTWVSV